MDQASPQAKNPPQRPKLGTEAAVALAGTIFMAVLITLTAMYAGPLWRDEINTLNVALMPSLHQLWQNMSFESFPPFWPLLERGCSLIGLVNGDASVRVLGLYVGLFFLISIWLSARWLGCRAPVMSVALLGSLPAFVFIIGANRAYGLACGLLVLCFGLLWRLVESPSPRRMVLTGFVCLLFAQCVYYDVVFLGAMLAGGALVAMRRRQWKTLGALAGIGAVSAASLAIYWPIIRRGSAYVPLMQWPFFKPSMLWNRFGDAVTLRSSGELGRNGPEAWLWLGLLLGGLVVALALQWTRAPQTPDAKAAALTADQVRADRALFCAVSMLVGVVGLFAFLLRLHYWTQSWYYIEMLCLCTLSLDGLLGANWPGLRPWGLLRVGFLVVMMCWGAKSVWEEAHTRRSDVDLIATVLDKSASAQDLIVVQTAWEAITFDRYYHGRAPWLSVPPIDSHKVHRNDLVFDQMNQPNAMAPVLREISRTLQGGHCVWLVGNMSAQRPVPPPANQPAKWFGTYAVYWNAQISSLLLDHARQEQVLDIPTGGTVCCLENLPVIRFAGYKSEVN
jgi:hypothetical protein